MEPDPGAPNADPGAGAVPGAGPVAPEDLPDPALAAASVDPDAPPVGEEFNPDGEPAPADLFGMPRDEFITAMEGAEDGALPESFYETMKVKITRDGVDELIPLSQWRDGGLRQADYSRKLNAVAEDKRAFSETQESFAGMVNGWKKNPATMADDLELLGIDIEAVLEPVAAMYAAEAELTPRERELAKRARNAERRERMADLRRRSEQEVLDRGKRKGQNSALQDKIEGYRTPAFVNAKVEDGPVARQIFHAHLRNLWQGGELTPRIAQDAAAATREDLIAMADDVESRRKPPAAAPAGAPVVAPPAAPGPPAARGAAPGGGGAAGARPSGTVSDFRQHIEALRDRQT
jgi:hypothetical protein